MYVPMYVCIDMYIHIHMCMNMCRAYGSYSRLDLGRPDALPTSPCLGEQAGVHGAPCALAGPGPNPRVMIVRRKANEHIDDKQNPEAMAVGSLASCTTYCIPHTLYSICCMPHGGSKSEGPFFGSL